MKKMKRLLAVILVLAMAVAIVVPFLLTLLFAKNKIGVKQYELWEGRAKAKAKI